MQGTIGAALLSQGTPYIRDIAKRYPRVTIAANGAAVALFLSWAVIKHSHRALKFVSSLSVVLPLHTREH